MSIKINDHFIDSIKIGALPNTIEVSGIWSGNSDNAMIGTYLKNSGNQIDNIREWAFSNGQSTIYLEIDNTDGLYKFTNTHMDTQILATADSIVEYPWETTYTGFYLSNCVVTGYIVDVDIIKVIQNNNIIFEKSVTPSYDGTVTFSSYTHAPPTASFPWNCTISGLSLPAGTKFYKTSGADSSSFTGYSSLFFGNGSVEENYPLSDAETSSGITTTGISDMSVDYGICTQIRIQIMNGNVNPGEIVLSYALPS